MVETRRTSRRLQAKATSSPSPSPLQRAPTRRSRRISLPLSQEKTPRQEKELAQEIPLEMTPEKPNKEEHDMEQETTTELKTHVEHGHENESVDVEIVAIAESDKLEAGKNESGAMEDEMVLLDDDDDTEDDGDEDEDVDYYASLAASSVNFAVQPATPSTGAKPLTSGMLKQRLVPTSLDSGASQFREFFDFEGSKRSQAATLRADARAAEEAKVVAATQKAVAHSERQRAESQSTKSAGRRWLNFVSDEMTADARRDFALLRMRNYLDPKKFYKSSDHSRALPKHFQMGVVIEGAHEFHSARMTKKQRRQTFTDEIMADEAVVQYTSRVAANIQQARGKLGRKKRRHN